MAADPNQNLLLVVDIHPTRYSHLAAALGAVEAKEAGYVWEIQTKYYTSQVDITTRTTVGDGSEGSILFKAHAIILCYTPNDGASIERVKESAKLMDELDYRPDVLLVVRIDDSAESTGSPDIEHLGSWCNEEGLEHVDFSTTTAEKTAAASEANESDSEGAMEDLVGVARIIEALQSTIWPNLLRQTPKSSTEQPSKPAEQAVSTIKKDNNDDDSDDDIEFPPEIVNCLEDLLRCLDEQRSLATGNNEDEEGSAFSLEDEAGRDPFEKTLRHVAFLRQMGSTLPHRHRQKLAELTAMAFATRMNLGDESDSDDDSDSDE